MIETLRHREAFEYYYKLGANRTLIQVAAQFNVSVQTTTKWNKSFSWQEKVQKRDNKNAIAIAERNDKVIVRDKAKDLKLIEVAKAVYLQQLKGSIDVECPKCHYKHIIAIAQLKPQFRDVDTLIRLSEFLSGGPDSRPEQVIRLEYVDPKPREKEEESIYEQFPQPN